MSDLLPCPFCGSTDVHTSPNGENYAYVYCNTCGAEGPTNDIGSVVMTWNRRAQTAQAVPPTPITSGAMANQRDADRYRWLREADEAADALIQADCRGVYLPQREALDRHIDTAMAQGAKT